MLIFTAVTIVIYMVIYALEWSWNYVELAPMIVDSENQAKLKQQAVEIAALSERLNEASRQKEIRIQIAARMRRGRDLHEQLAGALARTELHKYTTEIDEWKNQTIASLNEANLQIDGELFSQAASQPPTPEQQAVFGAYTDWKRYELARLDLYRKKLEEIVRSNRL
jgi:signal transduction histidine kinase